MDIQNVILKAYPLIEKVPCGLKCFLLENKKYLVFWENLITKDSINEVLNVLHTETKNHCFSKWKTIIVVGKTDSHFEAKELFYFDNESTFVVFVLVDDTSNDIFMNDSWIFALGCNFRRHVRTIRGIIKKNL